MRVICLIRPRRIEAYAIVVVDNVKLVCCADHVWCVRLMLGRRSGLQGMPVSAVRVEMALIGLAHREREGSAARGERASGEQPHAEGTLIALPILGSGISARRALEERAKILSSSTAKLRCACGTIDPTRYM